MVVSVPIALNLPCVLTSASSCGTLHCTLSRKFGVPMRYTSSRAKRFLRVEARKNEKAVNNLIGMGRTNRDSGWEILNFEDDGPAAKAANRPGSAKSGPGTFQQHKASPQVDVPPQQQNVIVEATRKGRGGKTVTIVRGLQHRAETLEAMFKKLKTQMGAGGALKDGCIEIQSACSSGGRPHYVGL
eukprot:TRINITY_DN5705_c0_g1_i1.p1 TRINITY_DN5705_c0_g1~~TRINITY_DN5705_c0_g1_i1.p1  ORF type:complete len:186 (-),score=32.08 TRINITY_DN5705_c0_g1_i1:75-632(-)